MGYSIRTDEWRLTIWLPFNNTVFVAEWDAPIIAIELYDHRGCDFLYDFRSDSRLNFDYMFD